LIVDFIGTPDEEDIECIPNERTKNMMKKLAKRLPKNMETEFPTIDLLGGISLFFKQFE